MTKDLRPDLKSADAEKLSSLRNPRILKLRKWFSRPDRARKEGVILVEGRHPTEEARAAGLELRLVVSSSHIEHVSGAPQLLAALRHGTKSHLHVADNVMETLSSDPSPQGLITVWDRPALAPFPPKPSSASSLIPALAQIQDPANVGSLIRSAAAFGAEGVLILEGTADPFHPKVIRASAGTVLRFPVWELPPEEPLHRALKILSTSGWRLTALSPSGDKDLIPSRMGPSHARILFLGSEGHGLPEILLEASRESFKIPIAPTVESLGVAAAGAVAIYAFKNGSSIKKGGGR
ncbi:MAG: RNA methyltransferase [Candidatus Eisenbacteria bacterium]|uniref:RNA methyltransferase n=1 Tax=Eiseniibacteriota bacterium TaxID=2212470 RepID=A0A948RXU1_UNCEI|nr:RNA methyltransferase [Candidatus Eisenbacteria bacterium]MBU2693020.1 RNA methyltransferase [Candidatus Eisenbacteria bacterium]